MTNTPTTPPPTTTPPTPPTPPTPSDQAELAKLARGLAPPELDSTSAARIAEVARRDVGHGPPKRRLIETIVVGGLVLVTLVWAALKVVEMLR